MELATQPAGGCQCASYHSGVLQQRNERDRPEFAEFYNTDCGSKRSMATALQGWLCLCWLFPCDAILSIQLLLLGCCPVTCG